MKKKLKINSTGRKIAQKDHIHIFYRYRCSKRIKSRLKKTFLKPEFKKVRKMLYGRFRFTNYSKVF